MTPGYYADAKFFTRGHYADAKFFTRGLRNNFTSRLIVRSVSLSECLTEIKTL